MLQQIFDKSIHFDLYKQENLFTNISCVQIALHFLHRYNKTKC